MKLKIYNVREEMDRDIKFNDWYLNNVIEYDIQIGLTFNILIKKVKMFIYIFYLISISKDGISLRKLGKRFDVSYGTIRRWGIIGKNYYEYMMINLK